MEKLCPLRRPFNTIPLWDTAAEGAGKNFKNSKAYRRPPALAYMMQILSPITEYFNLKFQLRISTGGYFKTGLQQEGNYA